MKRDYLMIIVIGIMSLAVLAIAIVILTKGISKEGNILDMAVNLDIIEKAGSWFSYNGERVGQGRENVKKYLKENPKVLEEVEQKVRENFAKAFEQSLGEELPSEQDSDEDSEEDFE